MDKAQFSPERRKHEPRGASRLACAFIGASSQFWAISIAAVLLTASVCCTASESRTTLTIKGERYEQIEIKSFDASTITIGFNCGVARIRRTDISPTQMATLERVAGHSLRVPKIRLVPVETATPVPMVTVVVPAAVPLAGVPVTHSPAEMPTPARPADPPRSAGSQPGVPATSSGPHGSAITAATMPQVRQNGAPATQMRRDPASPPVAQDKGNRGFIIAISVYVALMVLIILLHQAHVITVFEDYTDAAFSLGTMIVFAGACVVFAKTTLWVPRAVAGGLAAIGVLCTLKATAASNGGPVRAVLALFGKLIMNSLALGLFFVAFSSSSRRGKNSDESDAEYAARTQKVHESDTVFGLLAIAAVMGLVSLCTRRHEFSSVAGYLGFNRIEGKSPEPPEDFTEDDWEDAPEADDERASHEYRHFQENPRQARREEPRRKEARQEPPEDCYSVLGCSRTDSAEVIKRRYRELAKQYHPDAIGGARLPKDILEFATTKFRTVQDAYETIQRQRA